jgi:polyisoprenoid-binding protein YceI
LSCQAKEPAENESSTAPIELKKDKEVISSTKLTVDTESSSINWRGFKLAGLGEHSGNVKITSGSVSLENEEIVSGSVLIDMNTINATDLADDEELKGKLEGHLGAADFFDVSNHPTAKFEVISADKDKINGQLTVRGITKEVEAKIESFTVSEAGVELKAFLVFDRQLHNVSFQMAAGDAIISDDIEVSIHLVAKK